MVNGSLQAKKIVVIGGTSGIGLAVAEAALRGGAAVVVASSAAANVEAAVERLGDGASGSVLDVKSEDDLRRFFGEIGPFDHLAYTAGDWSAGGGRLADLDLTAAASGFAARFWGALATIKHGSPRIVEGGSIVLTDGVIAHRPAKGAAVSTAVLGAIEHLTRALAVDLAPIRVNAVCPGLVLTERNKQMPEEMRRRYTATQPLPRAGEPAEVAEAYLYLMRGGYTTGQVLTVDGGRTLV
jgi:NAD(P)-dependent dehydrogenase (short-subunit alcohol dehydrogenase family)